MPIIGHRIICGDCMDYLPVDCDLVVTDPPYGIDYLSGWQDYTERIQGDGEVVSREWFRAIYQSLKVGGALYVFCHWSNWEVLAQYARKVRFSIKNLIVLVKSNHGMGDLKGGYGHKHELLLFCCKGRHILRGKRLPDVWNVVSNYPKQYDYGKHPNEKPESWVSPCIECSSDPGDLVLDPFSGSGTVSVRCLRLGRRSVSIEIDPKFVELHKKRLAETKVQIPGIGTG